MAPRRGNGAGGIGAGSLAPGVAGALPSEDTGAKEATKGKASLAEALGSNCCAVAGVT